MKLIFTVPLILFSMSIHSQNLPIAKLDKNLFMGKWYSISSIPTAFDKNWQQTIENYSLNSNGYIDVFTTYVKKGETEERSIKSKLFPVKGAADGEMKAQFVWPFKAGYRIIELAPNYSYTVIGHPDRKYLFIMSRTPVMDNETFNNIVARCKAAGYDTEKLLSQHHKPI